jgi:hypothetical protein
VSNIGFYRNAMPASQRRRKCYENAIEAIYPVRER